MQTTKNMENLFDEGRWTRSKNRLSPDSILLKSRGFEVGVLRGKGQEREQKRQRDSVEFKYGAHYSACILQKRVFKGVV